MSRAGSTRWLALLLLGACGGDDGSESPMGDGEEATDFGNAPANAQQMAADGGLFLDAQPAGRTPGSDLVSFDGCMLVEVRKLDLLFVVDNSGSMREEQASLRREFPKLVRVLTTGDKDGDGNPEFPPVQDLHLGVVSSDMGLQTIDGIERCEGMGDDGILQHLPETTIGGCADSYPTFLSYTPDDNAAATAADFGCIAALGTDGCGFEQQLEAALKALTPSASDIEFLDSAGTADGKKGHGDRENAGFLRPNDPEGTSLVGVVVVTDEEDCSVFDTRHLAPPQFLSEDSPLRAQSLNTRCFHNPDNLYPVHRYVNGLRALREGHEELLVFGVLAGVPPELVDETARAGVDFADEAQREAYYQALLDDSRMQEVVDESVDPAIANLVPSCQTDNGKAYPPRRLVETARRLGENSVVQSICQDDFGPAIDALIDNLAARVEDLCMLD